MSSYLYVNYTPVSTPIAVPAVRGVQKFLAWDQFRGKRNLATSGAAVESVGYTDIMITFTLPGLQVGVGAVDYDAWAAFAGWALAGGVFTLAPCYDGGSGPPGASAKEYNCVFEANDAKIARAAMLRYNMDFSLRMLNDSSRAANAAEVMKSFWGQV